ncbi:MAG: SbcC/MukB-like Walker B domain-containing protein [Arachnia sp.]
MTTTDQMREWRDSAVSGGLPSPVRTDRWQVLRAGVVNLWEFEVAEYWYAGGWAQLMGGNETGKSTLMALTTLIPWLGSTDQTNIDTLGRSGKRFAYYVVPTDNDGDRRPVNASRSRGWLWVEYGILRDSGPEFFTTLLFADAPSATSQVKPVWCTVQGADRVRAGVLLTENRTVTAPKDLTSPEFIAHPNAGAYRRHVAQYLLGTGEDRLEATGKLLRLTRTPKLGEQLHIPTVQEFLRDSLPELERSEVDALAGGWDQVEQIQRDLDAVDKATAALATLRTRGWLPWVRAQLRHRADVAATARSNFDRVTRDEREAGEALTEREARATESRGRIDQLDSTIRATQRTHGELKDSVEYRDAAQRLNRVHELEAETRRLSAGLREQQDRVSQLSQRESTARDHVAAAEQRLTAAQDEASRARTGLDAELQSCGIHTPRELDVPDARQRLHDHRTRTSQALRLEGASTAAAAAADAADTQGARSDDQASEARHLAESAWADAEEARTTLADDVLAWAAHAPSPVADALLDRLVDELPRTPEQAARPGVLREALRTQWFLPAQEPWLRARADASQRGRSARLTADELANAITELENAPAPRMAEPATWRRRRRPEAGPGAPLWSLVDPRDNVTPEQLARLEAALAAAGFLDAWVGPDGVHRPDRDGLETVLTPPSGVREQRSLLEVLQPAANATDLAEVVDRFLGGVALVDEELPTAGVAVSLGGRWRTHTLHGIAASRFEHAEWLGEAARSAQRERRLGELAAALATAVAAAEAAEGNAAEAEQRLLELDRAMEASPHDARLVGSLLLTAERDRSAEQRADIAEQDRTLAAELRVIANTRWAELGEYCTDWSLPRNRSDLEALRERSHRAEQRLTALERRLDVVAAIGREHEAAGVNLAERHGELETERRLHGDRATELAAAQEALASLQSTIHAKDQEVRARLRNLEEALVEAERDRDAVRSELTVIHQELGRAEAKLADTKERRASAVAERDDTFARFRELVNHELPKELGLELPESGSPRIEHIRDQVAEVRRAVTITGWPEEVGPQQDAISSAVATLQRRAEDARIELEMRGRSVQLQEADGLFVAFVHVDASGESFGIPAALIRLGAIQQDLRGSYDEKVRQTLEQLLGSTFLEHLRDRIGRSQALVARTNKILAQHATGTTQTSLRIGLASLAEHAGLIEAVTGPTLADPEVSARISDHLKDLVEATKRAAEAEGDANWRERLAGQLDYRKWFDVQLQRRVGAAGKWSPLTTKAFAVMSGGARVVMLMLPLVATLAALYEDMEQGPRPLWLDEAFDGLDSANRATVMDLFREFDFDVLLAGPSRLVNVPTVPTAAIHQVVRAEHPLPGADLLLELWAGGELHALDLPSSAAAPASEATEEMLL